MAIAGSSAVVLLTQTPGRAQDATPVGTPDAAPANVIGVGLPGENALQFVGQVEQRGLDFSLAGYLTKIAGIDTEHLFAPSDPFARSELQAVATIVGVASATARSVLQNIFVIDAEGTFTIHAGTGGQTFDDPATFSAGAIVTSGSLVIQNVINVQAPKQGISTGFGALVVETADPFTLAEQTVQVSAPGVRFRLSMTGQGTLHNPETLEATILVAGNLVAAG